MNKINSSVYLNLTSSMISKNLSSDYQREILELVEIYFKFEFSSLIIIVLLAAVTIPTNILLLVMVYMDPLKCFNKPTTPFIVGLAVADLLTGLTAEPFFAVYYYFRYFNAGIVNKDISNLYRAGQFFTTVAISSSFLIVLVLSWSQFIAVAFPHRYSTLVTRRRATICVIAIWLYFIAFSLLQFTNIDMTKYLLVDLILHPTLISLVLLITIVFLYRSFQREIRRKKTLFQHKSQQDGRSHRRNNVERQFTIVTIYLAGIILASALPHVVVQYVFLELYHSLSPHAQIYVSMAIRIRDLLLFLKVALDAFIYAWRLKIYRETLSKTLSCCFRLDHKNNHQMVNTTTELDIVNES